MSEMRKLMDTFKLIDPQVIEYNDIDESYLVDEGRNPREFSNRLIDMIGNGEIDPLVVAQTAIGYMSDSAVEDMMTGEGWIENDPEYDPEYNILDDPDYTGPYDAAMMDPESER